MTAQDATNPVYYAIGDVHGRDDLLETLHGLIRADAASYAGRPAVIVYLGDYVDRGPASRQVIERVMAGVDGFETVCLKGNHEALIQTYLETGDEKAGNYWMMNGGRETIASYGALPRFGWVRAEKVQAAVPGEHLAWLSALPLYHETDDYIFVHAGIVPGRPMEEQKETDLLWIRRLFLDSERNHGKRVVHGHTPMPAPDVHPNRINVDTGAVWTGLLTCAVLDGTERPGRWPRFLTAEGPGDRHAVKGMPTSRV